MENFKYCVEIPLGRAKRICNILWYILRVCNFCSIFQFNMIKKFQCNIRFEQVPDEPKTHFVPPQLPPQDFNSGITQLQPVAYEDEESLQVKDQSLSSEPKSLLDTYIPSKIIASQDSSRYDGESYRTHQNMFPYYT